MSFTKIFLILCVIFSFSSCGSNSEDGETSTTTSSEKASGGLKHFPGDDFTMDIPAAWNIVTDDSNTVPSPKNGTVELAITSSETNSGFANNLIVLSQDLENYTSSKEYSIVNNVGAENEYLNYIKLSGKEFSFDDGEASMMYIFEAKYSAETPVLKFLQTAYVCNTNKAFFLTLALPTSLKDTTKYQKLLGSFTCK
ncbi:hypothetical protein LR004_00020 [Candidatus Gracilibacteria bacterium]|nr:hypothetical protein [Candidatus Gracilibacteria bacterium]